MKNKLFWSLLVIALGSGLLVAWIDSRPTWDDTGITAGVIFLVTACLGAVMPQRAWLWALAVGGWIPVVGIVLQDNYGSLLALVVGFIGASIGALGRKTVVTLIRAGTGNHPTR